MVDFADRVLGFAETVANRVGEQLLADFGNVQATEKSDGSLVTRADEWADSTLRQAIAKEFPDMGVLSEEGDRTLPQQEWSWVVDPLDGTTNFARGIPLWGISLGLLHRGVPVFGYVYFPPVRQVYHGFWTGGSGMSLPQGAWLNQQPIQPSQEMPDGNQFFSLCSRSVGLAPQVKPCKLRMMGVATYNLLLVVSGNALGAVEATPKIWDIAAVWTIAQAAGAVWLPLSESPFPAELGADYTRRSFPTLMVARSHLLSTFETATRQWFAQ